ncbi:LysR family transcriptional regulator [Thermophilibacter sp.]|uniref:LysR family transcriptional regulator n=1 Tax=Thermophilibacter sp. TaxID=2847309 RepID=UPI003A919662
MNIKQVRYVCAIMDLGSFSAAAAREGVSVQAVSKAMAELESSLGEPLFERRSAGVTPTPLGRAFATRARRVLDEWEALERFVSEPGVAPAPAPLRMGFCCPVYPGVERLVKLISTVTGKVLGRQVNVDMLRCSDALDALRSGRCDALITVGPLEADDVSCGALGTVSSDVLVPQNHPLAAKSEVTLDELADYPVLYPCDFEHYYRAVVDEYLKRGLRSEVVKFSVGDSMPDSLTDGSCYSFIFVGNITGAPEGFVIRPLAKGDALPVPICLSSLRRPGGIDFVAFRRSLSRLSLFG